MTSDEFKGLVADLARPFAIIVTSASAAVATVQVALRVTTFGEAALFIGAVYAGVAALYTAKAWENAKAGRQAADVAIAKSAPLVSPSDT